MTETNLSPEQAFDRIAYRLGGRYLQAPARYVGLLEQIRTLLAGFAQSRRVSNVPPIYVDFFDSPTFNAFAAERRDQAFIGLSRGLLDGFHNAIDSILADETLLGTVGLSEEALLAAGAQAEFDALPESIRAASGGIVGMAQSQCALLITKSALHFTLWHEVAHITHGHTRLTGALGELGVVLETDSGIEKQTLEMDADAAAVTQSMNVLLALCKRSTHQTAAERVIYARASTALCCWYLSIFLFFRLQVRPGPILYTVEDRSHPPPIIRQMYVAATLLERLSQRRSQEAFAAEWPLLTSLEDALPRCGEWIVAAERAFAAAARDEPDFQAIQVSASPECAAYLNRLHATWANGLYQKLLPLTRTTLPPPQL